ncbi:unnamed protein product [Moneuplotes crassus]|uniref:Uncharacterized protein n=1 Tax=Euplotes crassus TaxID=5936 RepID=A0AAD1Y3K2_EUPCR|nr:unnamed protein product [Moneuplotes crassus]
MGNQLVSVCCNSQDAKIDYTCNLPIQQRKTMPIEAPRTMGRLMDPAQDEPLTEPENTDGEGTKMIQPHHQRNLHMHKAIKSAS